MAGLMLRVFGAPRVERNSAPIELNLRRALALLVYLAVTGRPQGRETLGALLWPDSDERDARARLRRTRHRLTTALGEDVVLSEGDTMGLTPGAALWVDATAFEQQATAGLAVHRASEGTGAATVAHLTQAAALYVDDFLSGFGLPDAPEWEAWQFFQREGFRQRLASVLEHLVAEHQAQANWDAAIPHARRWVALDPLHEPARRALMRLLAQAGQQAAALRQYQECVRALQDEVGVEPEPETTALYEAIRARRLDAPAAERPDRAPSPPSPSARSATIPLLPGPLIGRQRELASARSALLDDGVRLLTLTGPPGVGKTSLALALAHDLDGRFADRAWLVDLTPLVEPDEMARVLAERLQVPTDRQQPLNRVRDFLQSRELLLVFDNFEHLIDAAPLAADLLAACSGLRILVTSRIPLRVRWERELSIDPLQLPEASGLSPAALSEVAAVKLFVERARAVSRDLALTADTADAIAAICVRLDGLPLAIELAAARVRTLSLDTILLQLAETGLGQAAALDVLTEGPRDLPARQQALRDAIGWSYDLLAPAEQAVFRRLAVFAGGCTLDAAYAVCAFCTENGADDGARTSLPLPAAIFDSLPEKNLVRVEQTGRGGPRLRMLETIRQYALEQLIASGEAELVRARHADYFVDLAERAEPGLSGPHPEQWLALLERERGNFWAVERWALSQGDAGTELIVRVGAAMWLFWVGRGDAVEARDRVAALLPLVHRVPPTATLVRALHGGGLLAERLGDYATCRSLFEQGIDVARQLDDRRLLAGLLDALGRQEFVEGHYARSRERLEESLTIFRQVDDRPGLTRALSHRGFLEYLEGRPEPARAIFQEGLTLSREMGDQSRVAEFLDNIGVTLHVQGDFDRAASSFEEAVAIWREIGQGHWLAQALNNLGTVQVLRGEPEAAREQLREALTLARTMGNRRWQAFVLGSVAMLAAAEGQAERALWIYAAASAAAGAMGAVLAQPIHAQRSLLLNRAREELSSTRAEAAATAGRAASLDRAVEEALDWLSSSSRHNPGG